MAAPSPREELHATIRDAGGIVHSDGNIFFTNADKFLVAARAAIGAALPDQAGWIPVSERLPKGEHGEANSHITSAAVLCDWAGEGQPPAVCQYDYNTEEWFDASSLEAYGAPTHWKPITPPGSPAVPTAAASEPTDSQMLDWLEQAYSEGAGFDNARRWRNFMTDVADRGYRDAIRAAMKNAAGGNSHA